MRLFGALAVCLSTLAGVVAANAANSPPPTVTASRLVDIPISQPDDAPTSLVVYLSDRSGWTARDDAMVEAMRQAGSVVLSVDFSRYGKALDADTGECLYVVGEITDLAQAAMRKLDIATYLPPVVAGSGEGATFAYAAIADSPANTLGGAVALGFANYMGLRLPFCPGAKATKAAGGGYSYGFDAKLPDGAYLLVDQKDFAAVEEATADADDIALQALDAGKEAGQLVEAVQALMDELTPPGDLPVIDLPATGKPAALALFVSGDGGWRDLDKTMGEWMAGKGVHVIGFDALRYFWSKRRPEEFAADISDLIRKADPDGTLPVMLIGYSFGADTLPFTWPYLSQELKKRTRLVALLAPSATTSFEVSVGGYLGIDDGEYKIAPAIAALPAHRVLCAYGEDDDDGACPDKLLDGITRIRTTGGHHFDGDYDKLGGQLMSAFAERLAAK